MIAYILKKINLSFSSFTSTNLSRVEWLFLMRAIANQIVVEHFLQYGTIQKCKYVEFQGQKVLKEGPGEGQFIAYNTNPSAFAVATLTSSDVVFLCRVTWKLRTVEQMNKVVWGLWEGTFFTYVNEEKSGEVTSSTKAWRSVISDLVGATCIEASTGCASPWQLQLHGGSLEGVAAVRGSYHGASFLGLSSYLMDTPY